MIRKLEVKGLNNRLDGAWEFNKDLNVITGRNGSGKTTLLKLIWYLMSGNIVQVISEILFQSVSMETDSFSLSLYRTTPNAGKFKCTFTDQKPMEVGFKIPLQGANFLQLSGSDALFSRAENRSLFFPSFRRIEGGFNYLSKDATENISAWLDETLWLRLNNLTWRSADESTEMVQKAISQFSADLSVSGEHEFVAAISTHDIDELLNRKYTTVSTQVNALYEQLSKEIAQTISETKDPDNEPKDTSPVLEDIQKQLEQVTKQRGSLMKPFSVLSERIRDTLLYKGIRITEEITLGEEDGAIESDKLSAGEKQMLSFWCYNAFSENTAIFIDEPELSLHVDWQRLLLPTLLEQETGNQFFVATHSPFIYTKYPEREILLDEGPRRRLMPKSDMTVDECVALLRRTDLQTVIVEGCR